MLKKKIVFVFLTKVIFVTLDSFLAAKDTQKKRKGGGGPTKTYTADI